MGLLDTKIYLNKGTVRLAAPYNSNCLKDASYWDLGSVQVATRREIFDLQHLASVKPKLDLSKESQLEPW